MCNLFSSLTTKFMRFTKVFYLLAFFVVLLGGLSAGRYASAQACFSGSAWQGPSSDPVTANRAKPVYTDCSAVQTVTSNWSITNAVTGNPTVTIANTSTDVALQVTAGAGLAGQFVGNVYVNGSIGIGISTPNKQLHVKTTSGNAEIDIQSGSSPWWALYQDEGSNELRFWNTGSNNLLVLSAFGNVGIGNITPSTFKLEIAGTTGPSANGVYDLGADGRIWNDVYADRVCLDSSANCVTTWSDSIIGSGNFVSLQNPIAAADTGGFWVSGASRVDADVDVNGSMFLQSNLTFDIGGGGELQNIGGKTDNDIYDDGDLVISTDDRIEFADNGATYAEFGPSAGEGNFRFNTNGNDLYVADNIQADSFSTYDQVVTDQTVEAARFCIGDEDAGGTCVNDWDNVSLYWTLTGTTIHPLTLSNDVAIGVSGVSGNERLRIGDAAGPRVLLSREDTNTVTDDWLGQIMFDDTDGGVSTVDASVLLRAMASENHGSGDKGGYFVIETKPINRNASQSSYERVRVMNEGDVEGKFVIVRDDTSTNSGDLLGQIGFDATDGGISSDDLPAMISAYATENYGSGDKGADLVFSTKPTNRNAGESAYERVRITEAGRVGIGTPSPSYNLDVSGSANADQLCINGSCISSWSSAGIQGSGTTDYVPKWTGATTLGNSLIYDDGTNVGIGISSPAEKLTIAQRNLSGLFNGLGIGEDPSVSANRRALFSYYDDGSDNSSYLRVSGKANGGSHLVVMGSGNVGINTSSPSSRLQVNAGTDKEGIRIVASNYSPFVIRDSSDASDIFRINQNSQASGSATVQSGPSGGSSSNASKIPILDAGGLIDQTLLPFKKGDLIAPSDRSTVEGASGASYTTDYFNIDMFNINISTQSSDQVCSGTRFGPGYQIKGAATCSALMLDDTDNDSYFDCDQALQGNDCNDETSSAYRDSPKWWLTSTDPAYGEYTGNWKSCNASWSSYPGDYNCDNVVEYGWIGERYGCTDPLGSPGSCLFIATYPNVGIVYELSGCDGTSCLACSPKYSNTPSCDVGLGPRDCSADIFGNGGCYSDEGCTAVMTTSLYIWRACH